MNDQLRDEAIRAVHDLEAVTVEPEVEEYVDTVLSAVAARLAAVEAELRDQWEANHFEHCGRDWPHPEGRACHWPLPVVLRAEPSETTRDE